MAEFDPLRPASSRFSATNVTLAVATCGGAEVVEFAMGYGNGQSLTLTLPVDAAREVGWKLVAAADGLPMEAPPRGRGAQRRKGR